MIMKSHHITLSVSKRILNKLKGYKMNSFRLFCLFLLLTGIMFMLEKLALVVILSVASCSNSTKYDLIRQFLKQNNVKVCYFVLCWDSNGKS